MDRFLCTPDSMRRSLRYIIYNFKCIIYKIFRNFINEIYFIGRIRVDCIRSKNFLENNHIPFKEINILENESAIKSMKKINNGKESVPTIIINNNTVVIEPTDDELIKAITKELEITEQNN